VLGDLDPHRRQVEHLTPLHPHRQRVVQIAAATTARRGLVAF
jgi:hypothetical protein